KVKDQVATAWKKEKQAEKAAAEVDEMAKAVRDGKKMTAFANQPGVEVRLSKPISLLGDMDRDVPVSVLPQILQMKSGDVITAALPDRHFVLRLADVVPVDPTKPGPGRLKIEDSLKENLPNEIPEEYARFLHERFPIKINQNVLDFMKKQGS
ncbi:MAG: hypothetical protein HGA90_02945, partial [Alphaproteobacteria bacterium]|nr:hypothetical protein [Alphaproteobacteria bacterium]